MKPDLMPRSWLVRLLTVLVACAIAAGWLFPRPCEAQPNQVAAYDLPNIVILYADDLGYGDPGCMNPESKIPTPSLDQLARQGIRFTDAHSSSGICTPSRYALLTGRYHWRAFHDIVDSFGASRLDAAQLTLPEMLQQRGYRTGCVGKWHLGWDWDAIRRDGARSDPKTGFAANDFDWSQPIPGGPLVHGFDYYFGDDVPNFPPYAWIENDRITEAPTRPFEAAPPTAEGNWECRPGPMVAGWQLDAVVPRLTDQAVRWIERSAATDQPFFLYFALTSPHAPIVPSAAFAGKSGAGGYGDFVVQSDAACGAVLEALQRMGLEENTIVIFSSDNGPEIYCYERVKKFGHRSMGPLRGIKRDVWEGGHRVPMIVRWPEALPAGQTCDRLIVQTDLFATIAGIVNFPLENNQAEDSINQLPVWRAPESAAVRTWAVHNTYARRFALRQDQWLVMDGPDGNSREAPQWFAAQEGWEAPDAPFALYDLASDPGQKFNLASRYPDRVELMLARLKEIRASSGSIRNE